MTNKALDTAALALGFTATEEFATVNSVIAWTVAAMDSALGWTHEQPWSVRLRGYGSRGAGARH